MSHDRTSTAGVRVLHTAELLLTMSPSGIVPDAGVVLDASGRILESGPLESLRSGYDVRFDHGVLMPGVVNCHTHLTDANIQERVPGGEGLIQWVRRLLAERGSRSPSRESGVGPAGQETAPSESMVQEVIRSMQRGGTVAIGEVCNDVRTFDAIVDSGIDCLFIHELIGFRKEPAPQILDSAFDRIASLPSADRVQHTIGAHAPYSVSPELLRAIVQCNRASGRRTFIHLAEDPDERRLYLEAAGPWREFLHMVGAWEPTWESQELAPIGCYDRMGLLDGSFVAVHLADATPGEIAMLGRQGVLAVLCPGSNQHITGLLPPVMEMVRAGIRFGFGTDGRGSGPSIDVFDEAAILLDQFPDIPGGLVLHALTTIGAEIVQMPHLGSIVEGKRPGLVTIDTPLRSLQVDDMERAILFETRERRRVA